MGKSGIGKARRARLNVLREAALHRDTVARRLPEGFNGRWTRRQWAHASLFATLAALVAAIVPGFSPIAQPGVPTAARTTLALSLPPLSLARQHGQAGDSWQVVHLERGQTLGSLFDDFDLPAGGGLRGFRYDRDDTHRVEYRFDDGLVVEKVIERPTQSRTVVISGT